MKKKELSKHYDLTYDNVAIPEVHTRKKESTNQPSSQQSVDYENLAIPEVHIKKNNK